MCRDHFVSYLFVHSQGDIAGDDINEVVTRSRLDGDRITAEIGGRTLTGDVCCYQHLDEEVCPALGFVSAL